MSAERLEPFRHALVDLRRRLRDGVLEPGARITAKAVAEELRLSPTPVREALSRLAGEGLLQERRREGYFVPKLTVTDIAALYRMSEHFLLMAEGASRGRIDAPAPVPIPEPDPVQMVERLFLGWAMEANSRVIIDGYRSVMIRLAPVRRREPQLLVGLASEAAALAQLAASLERPRRAQAIQAFHRRRIAAAEGLARLFAPPDQDFA